MLFLSFILLMMPMALANLEQKESKTSDSDIMICMMIHNITRNGYFYYNVTNLKNETIDNVTILLDIRGGAIFHGKVHVSTSIIIENLSGPLHSKLYRTEEQVFMRKQYPIFGKPLLGAVIVEETYNDQSVTAIIHIWFAFLTEYIPYEL